MIWRSRSGAWRAPAGGVFIVTIMIVFAAACGPAPRKGAPAASRPAHHTADGFQNLYVKDPDKSVFDFLAMKYFGDDVWADHAARAGEVPTVDLDPKILQSPPAALQITWLGHSTFLLQRDGINILTDPIFGDRASPFPFAGPKRYVRHAIDYALLPKIDYVVISHNHYDHLDTVAVERLGNQPVYLVPLGLGPWLAEHGVRPERVREMDWWAKASFASLEVQAMPSQHWSARGLNDRRETLWASWLLDIAGRKVWFAGDTGYNDVQFKEIGQAAGGIDVGLIPIGGYLPRDFMRSYHVNPEEAVLIHRDIGARVSIGMHWGTLPLTAEGPGDPALELARQRKAHGLAPDSFITMAIGGTFRR